MSGTGGKGLSVSGLYVIAACFAAAALLRAGDVAAQLAAEEAASPATEMAESMPAKTTQKMASMESTQGDGATDHGAMAPAGAEQAGMPGGTPQALLNAIQARTATLNQREMKIAKKERALEVVKARIAEEMSKLKVESDALAALVEEARRATAEGTEHLVKIYRTMKPKKAGAIFNEMDPRVAAEFLREMNGEAASYIIANMDAKKAYTVTLLMAGRNMSLLSN